ncbi:cysteine synthase [Trifolium repens]|nr:cysteine synthase [Trifolium repens]
MGMEVNVIKRRRIHIRRRQSFYAELNEGLTRELAELNVVKNHMQLAESFIWFLGVSLVVPFYSFMGFYSTCILFVYVCCTVIVMKLNQLKVQEYVYEFIISFFVRTFGIVGVAIVCQEGHERGKDWKQQKKEYVEGYEFEEEDDIEDFGPFAIHESQGNNNNDENGQ